jgi:hypothetical protein
MGAQLGVLALGEAASQAEDLARSTGTAAAVFLALWLLAGLLDDDRVGGFAAAADTTAPGAAGRLLGRWLGASATATAAGALAAWGGLLLAGHPLSVISLLFTIIWPTMHAAALGAAAATRLGGGGALAIGSLAYAAGHLPWGTAGYLTGRAGAALSALLPGDALGAGPWNDAGYTALAVSGFLLVALALSPRAGSGE